MRTAVTVFALSFVLQLIGCQAAVSLWAFKIIEAETALAWVTHFAAIPVGCFVGMVAVISLEARLARNDRRLRQE